MKSWTWASLVNANGTPATTRDEAITVLRAVFPGDDLGAWTETDTSTGIIYFRVEVPNTALEVEDRQGWAEFGQAGIGLVLLGDPDDDGDADDE